MVCLAAGQPAVPPAAEAAAVNLQQGEFEGDNWQLTKEECGEICGEITATESCMWNHRYMVESLLNRIDEID